MTNWLMPRQDKKLVDVGIVCMRIENWVANRVSRAYSPIDLDYFGAQIF